MVPPLRKVISMACIFLEASQSWNASQSHVLPSQASGTSSIGSSRTVATQALKQFVGVVCLTAFGRDLSCVMSNLRKRWEFIEKVWFVRPGGDKSLVSPYPVPRKFLERITLTVLPMTIDHVAGTFPLTSQGGNSCLPRTTSRHQSRDVPRREFLRAMFQQLPGRTSAAVQQSAQREPRLVPCRWLRV